MQLLHCYFCSAPQTLRGTLSSSQSPPRQRHYQMMQGKRRHTRASQEAMGWPSLVPLRADVGTACVGRGPRRHGQAPRPVTPLVWLDFLCFDFDDARHAAAKLPCQRTRGHLPPSRWRRPVTVHSGRQVQVACDAAIQIDMQDSG